MQSSRALTSSTVLAFGLLMPTLAGAQPAPPATPPDPALRFRLPTLTVTAQKEPEDKQKVPVSVTAVAKDTIDAAAIHLVSEAAIFAPNTYFTEWSARKLSHAQFRGIGSSPSNPGITTFIDGVPQLNVNSSSIELLDIDQVEFVRGPQSALFGRNTLGGVVNVSSARPSLGAWTGTLSAPFGNQGAWGIRGAVAGPVIRDKMSIGVSFAKVDRDGFTVNQITGNDIDSRSAFSGKAQLLWTPNSAWEGRVIFTGERARDGDYSLHDVGALRTNPFTAARDFEGHVDRDVTGTTILARRSAGRVVFSSTTGLLKWKTQDVTDLDYTPFPALRRDNTEEDFQFTQEVRLASAETAPVVLSDAARLRWQSGLFLFTQSYEQDAINSYAAGLFGPIALTQHTPRSALDDFGLGLFGQATVTFNDRIDVAAGARFDYEDKSADIETFFDLPVFPAARVEADDSFSNVSPQLSVAFRADPEKTFYGTVGRGYKAGGFNPTAPPGQEAYGEELTWNIEGGLKTLWAGGRVSANAAVFYIDWNDLQLTIPNAFAPAQFYIANVGAASSKGVELEVSAKAAPDIDVFASLGYTNARFATDSRSGGIDVAGNRIPNTPNYTFATGIQYSRAVGPATVQARADAVFYGDIEYTDQNTLGQDAFSLVNFRLGVTGGVFLGELVVRNAFDTHFIPVAFPYPNFTQSGFVGEMGPPRTVSFRAGVRF